MNQHPSQAQEAADATSKLTVFIVDDDEAVRDSMRWLLEGHDFTVQSFPSAETFLAALSPETRGCAVVDVRMPGMTGPELQDELIRRGYGLPVIFVTGHGDVPMAVESMKKGAVDFLEKPFNDQDLVKVVESALERALSADTEEAMRRQAEELLSRLTPREEQVLERIVAGRLNKQIADDLGISIKTVEAHRANIMDKLGVRSMADLMKVALARG